MRLPRRSGRRILWLLIALLVARSASAGGPLGAGVAVDVRRCPEEDAAVRRRDRSRPSVPLGLRGGGWFVPAGWNPLGYRITALGEEFLGFDGALESDVGRFLASLKSGRKRFPTLRAQWLEVLRVSKSGQSMRIYKRLQDLLQFCLRAGLID